MEEAKVRVLVVIRNSLLGDILGSLLAGAIRLQVQTVLCINPEGLWIGIEQYQPDVLVMEESLIEETLIAGPGNTTAFGRIRIIAINPAANQVKVYDKFQISLTHFTDFVALIENHPR